MLSMTVMAVLSDDELSLFVDQMCTCVYSGCNAPAALVRVAGLRLQVPQVRLARVRHQSGSRRQPLRAPGAAAWTMTRSHSWSWPSGRQSV